jgi:hypothetical protein
VPALLLVYVQQHGCTSLLANAVVLTSSKKQRVDLQLPRFDGCQERPDAYLCMFYHLHSQHQLAE